MKGTRIDSGQIASLGATALLSAVLFYSGFFTFLFAVPVQVAWTRHGMQRGVSAAGITGLLILVSHAVQAVRLTGGASGLVLVDALMPLGLLGGLVIFNGARQYPWWLRLLAGGALALAGAFPSLRIIAMLGQENGEVTQQFSSMLAMMGIEHGQTAWIALVRRVVLNSVGIALVAGIAANWWLGTGIVLRSRGTSVTLRGVSVPEQLIWMVIGGLAIILMTWVSGADRLAPLGWNLFLVGGFLFALQGVGVIQHLLYRRGLAQQGERWVLTVLLVGLFIPGINIVVAGGLPLLGMSELWIDFKRGERYEGNSE
ncbi:MAG: hypothetical protein EA427_13160 [Spirochaetaceae bacterium]|nr:MAG: hypothetical protein EA427_13160 [Spirochaetaceae bacterium]